MGQHPWKDQMHHHVNLLGWHRLTIFIILELLLQSSVLNLGNSSTSCQLAVILPQLT